MRSIVFVVTLFFYLLSPMVAFAEIGVTQPTVNAGIPVPCVSADSLVQTAIKAAVGLFFTIAAIGIVIQFVRGGAEWIWSGGDKEKISGGQKKITTALIGLVLMASSFIAIRTVGQIVGFDPLDKLQIPSFSGQYTGCSANGAGSGSSSKP